MRGSCHISTWVGTSISRPRLRALLQSCEAGPSCAALLPAWECIGSSGLVGSRGWPRLEAESPFFMAVAGGSIGLGTNTLKSKGGAV